MSLSALAAQASLSERRTPTFQSIIHNLVPAIVCFYATAILALLPRTFAIRLAILPITLWTAFRATTLLDFSFGNYQYACWNQSMAVFMFVQSLRSCIWTFRIDPYARLTSNNHKSSSREICFNAFDLICNMRGIGWSWPQGLRIPKETRNILSTKSFLLTTLQWLIRDLIAFDFCHYAVQIMLAKSDGFPFVGIFDASLPPLHRYARSTIITTFTGFAVYLGIECQYHFATLIAIIVFQQPPSLWPPISEQPYRSTSLNQFWSVRWHQSFRDIFIRSGGAPLSYLFGKTGGIFGAFLISGVLHDIGCWSMGKGTDTKSISGFFLMNGIGILLEHFYKSMAGKRVQGVVGYIWTNTWLIVWGSLLVNAWFECGLAASRFWPLHASPAFNVHRLLSSFL